MSFITRIALIAVCSLLLFACEREGLAPGLFPPKISLPSLGKMDVTHGFESYRGKVILLNFWATWCPPCVAEMPSLERLYQRFKDRGFVVIGIATQDDMAEVESFIKKNEISFPILFDFPGDVSQKFQVNGFPETLLIDREGKLKLLPDPKTGELALRIQGERNWDDTSVIDALTTLLAK